MEQWAVALHVTLIVLMMAAVWRVWVLGRQVRQAADAARSARTDVSDRNRGVGTALSAYPVSIHAASASAAVPVKKAKPDTPGGAAPVSTAVPILMLNTPASVKLGEDVALGNVTHVVAGSVVFEVLPGAAWTAVPPGGGGGAAWSKPGNSSDVLVWGRPLSAQEAKRFPFPPLREDSAVQLGPPEAGYSAALVLAF